MDSPPPQKKSALTPAPHLHERCDPEEISEGPAAHEALEDYDANPSSEGPHDSSVCVVIRVIKRRPARNTLFVRCEPEVLRTPDVDVEDGGYSTFCVSICTFVLVKQVKKLSTDEHVEVRHSQLPWQAQERHDLCV